MEITSKIREYGQKRNIDGLQSYIKSLSDDELVQTVKTRLVSPEFVNVWDYLMQSFTVSSESHVKRFKVILTLLRELENISLPSSQSSSLITQLCIELPKFKSGHLISLCDFCMECIQKGNVTEMCWKDILPELLNVLVEREAVEFNDVTMTGLEYKNNLVNSLCMLVWSPSIVTSLTSMFIDMPLTKEEHSQVVNKLGQCMEKLSCQEIPAFIYQLLKLCRYQNSRSIFLRLQYYFGIRIYNKVNSSSDNDTDSMDIDAIGDTTQQEAIEVESTVLFHIYQCASLGHESIRDYLNSLKNMTKSPEFILHPFQLTVLLIVSTISIYEERSMEILRVAFSRTVQEEYKKQESCWFQEMVPSTCKVEDVIHQIINCSGLMDRHLVVQGLVQLAYVLLGVGAGLGKEQCAIAERLWQLGKLIILKIIKKKRSIASCIITSLSNRIVSGQNAQQYIDCIYSLSHKMSLIMLENQSCVVELMEYLIQIPGRIANQLLDALLPLAKLSPTIRDHLILLLRKALYSRVTETRQTAVSGFLKLIKCLKISNLAALSQSSGSSTFSGHSVLTQVSLSCTGRAVSSTFSNEALCLEVLGILRRCFMQQIEVKAQLYEGLYDAVCMNAELGIPVLDVIWTHFSSLYVADRDELPPLNFSKVSVINDIDVILQEPLGKLIYAIGLIVTKIKEEEEDNPTVTKFTEVLESLCSRMINCELIHFELDDGTDLTDVIPESQQKVVVLKEVMSVYEALIGYKICSWGPQSESNAQQINSLYQSYSRFLNFAQRLIKPKKGDKKKKKDLNRTSQSHNNTTKTVEGVLKSKSFKLPTTLLDFQTIGKMLHLLHKSTVPWTSTTQANTIKTKTAIHRHIMKAALQLVKELKAKKSLEIHRTKSYYNYMTEIAGILYEHCIIRFNEFLEFDSETAILALECFYLILVVISMHFKENLGNFLAVIGSKNKDDELTVLMKDVIVTYQNLIEADEEDASSDPEAKKISLHVVNTLALFSVHIPSGTSILSNQHLNWLKTYMDNNVIKNKNVVTPFVNLVFTVHIKFKSTVTIFENAALRLSEVLGAVNETKPQVETPKLIDDLSASSIFPILCNSLKVMLDDINWIISRLRSEYSMICYPGEDNPERKREYLKSKERGVCCQLCPLITIVGVLSNITIPPGPLLEALLKIVSHLYNTLTSLTKYFTLRSSKVNLVFQGARFERVVKLAGKQLSQVVYEFIVYIEDTQKQEVESSQSKKKSVDTTALKSKVLRETRLIPKVIYEIEQFGKSVIQLSNKTKVDLAKFIGQGTARDFRIKNIKEVMEKAGHDGDISLDDNTVADTSTEVDNANEEDIVVSDAENANSEEEVPPRKKAKV